LALAKAGGINQERNNTKMTGIALRQSAANFGRGLGATGLQASQMALGAGASAAGIAGQAQGSRATALAPAAGFYNGAVGSNQSAASILGALTAINAVNAKVEALTKLIHGGMQGRGKSSAGVEDARMVGMKPLRM
jgi:hypothetical protein